MQAITLPTQYVQAKSFLPLLKYFKVSSENVEKVVNPPQSQLLAKHSLYFAAHH